MLPTHKGLSKVEDVLVLGEWAWSPEHGELCRVIETQTHIRAEAKGLSNE